MPCRTRHDWDAEVTCPSLQSLILDHSGIVYYAAFAVPDYALHTPGGFYGIDPGMHGLEPYLASAYCGIFAIAYPCLFD